MNQAIIDIGSNSMRLTVYETDGQKFKILFKEKIIAGLAGYVDKGVLSTEGIECAYTGVLEFRGILESLHIEHVAVFATASLRNIKNTAEAVSAIKNSTGYDVEIISGEDEAFYGYTGAMQEVHLASGAFVDIGGASTEVVSFENGEILDAASFQMGSLVLYKECVKKIMPGEGSMKKIQKMISDEIDKKSMLKFEKRSPLVCVGGTSRAVMKIAKKLYDIPSDCYSIPKDMLNELCQRLYKCDKAAANLILKLEPERIHTIVPGIMILQQIFKLFDSDEIVVSRYGAREGYLCQRILKTSKENIYIPKTEN